MASPLLAHYFHPTKGRWKKGREDTFFECGIRKKVENISQSTRYELKVPLHKDQCRGCLCFPWQVVFAQNGHSDVSNLCYSLSGVRVGFTSPWTQKGLYDCLNKWKVAEVTLHDFQGKVIKGITTSTCFLFSLGPRVLGNQPPCREEAQTSPGREATRRGHTETTWVYQLPASICLQTQEWRTSGWKSTDSWAKQLCYVTRCWAHFLFSHSGTSYVATETSVITLISNKGTRIRRRQKMIVQCPFTVVIGTGWQESAPWLTSWVSWGTKHSLCKLVVGRLNISIKA